jgi:hypothetical protein
MYDIDKGDRRTVDAVRASLFVCSDNEIVSAFFSNQNIAALQTQIRTIMKEKYGHSISNQDETELVLIMRGIYNMNDGSVVDTNIPSQVGRLNALVLQYVIPQIRTNIRHYLGYLRDSTRPYTLLERPQNTSQKGETTLFL